MVTKSLAVVEHPTVLVQTSKNTIVWEQGQITDEYRTFIVIPCQDDAFARISKREPQKGYVLLAQWAMVEPGALSFSIPRGLAVGFAKLPAITMIQRYGQMKEDWQQLDRLHEYDGVITLDKMTGGAVEQ